MCSHVSCQVAALLERFVAHSAPVWGHLGVFSHVKCKTAACGECFVTHSTLVWGLLGVFFHVNCQAVDSIERLVAHNALKLLGMHFQVLFGCVCFIAAYYCWC